MAAEARPGRVSIQVPGVPAWHPSWPLSKRQGQMTPQRQQPGQGEAGASPAHPAGPSAPCCWSTRPEVRRGNRVFEVASVAPAPGGGPAPPQITALLSRGRLPGVAATMHHSRVAQNSGHGLSKSWRPLVRNPGVAPGGPGAPSLPHPPSVAPVSLGTRPSRCGLGPPRPSVSGARQPLSCGDARRGCRAHPGTPDALLLSRPFTTPAKTLDSKSGPRRQEVGCGLVFWGNPAHPPVKPLQHPFPARTCCPLLSLPGPTTVRPLGCTARI